MGLRPGDSMFLIDGLNIYEWGQGQQLLNGYAPAGDAATILPIDAIQEFNIQQNPKAEFGWKPGVASQRWAEIRHQFHPRHGLRLWARRFVGREELLPAAARPCQVPSLSFEQYGATAGGPILKDKLFWFVGFEAQTLDLGITAPVMRPCVCSPCASAKCIDLQHGRCLQRHWAAQTSLPLSATWRACSGNLRGHACLQLRSKTCSHYNPGNQFTGNPTRLFLPAWTAMSDVNSTYNGLAKVDYHPNDKNTLSGMFFIGDGSGTWNDNPSAITSAFVRVPVSRDRSNRLGQLDVCSELLIVNEFKVGYTHYHLPFILDRPQRESGRRRGGSPKEFRRATRSTRA